MRASIVAVVLIMVSAINNAAVITDEQSSAHFYEAGFGVYRDPVAEAPPSRWSNEISGGYIKTSTTFTEDFSKSKIPLNIEIAQEVLYMRYVRHRSFATRGDFYFGGGGAYSKYRFTSTPIGVVPNATDDAGGPHLLVGMTYHLSQYLAIDANFAGYLFFSKNSSYLVTPQLRFTVSPFKHLNMELGYRYWHHYMDFNDSNIVLEVVTVSAGPSAGVSLAF